MTISKITYGSRKSPRIGYQATQLLGERIIVSIAPTRLEAIREVINELNRDWNIPY